MLIIYIKGLFDLIWSLNTRLQLLDMSDHTIKMEQAGYSAQMSFPKPGQWPANSPMFIKCLRRELADHTCEVEQVLSRIL